jgi:hypothetical protein
MFQRFIDSLETSCLICSPYITIGPVTRLVEAVHKKNLQDSLTIKVVTDVSAVNLLNRSTDVSALLMIAESIRNTDVIYLPRIHAKVYVSGDSLAIISSANFTDGGIFANLEYGVVLEDTILVKRITEDIEQYSELGGMVTQDHLIELKDRVGSLRAAIQQEQQSIDQKFRQLSTQLQRETEDDLIRVRIKGRSINSIFSETIAYLLSRHAMTTPELHSYVREIHPDLCDDTVDRVIDGQRFGKLWKHQVRIAQQHLKQNGIIDYDPQHRIWKKIA